MNIETEIKLVNNIIKESITHGADAGGSYGGNAYMLESAIDEWLKYKNVLGKYILRKIDVDGWNLYQIVSIDDIRAYDNLNWLYEL